MTGLPGTDILPIFDGHNDTLLRLHSLERGNGRTFFAQSDQGHLDLPRARAGGFAGGLFAVFVLPKPATGEQNDPDSTNQGPDDEPRMVPVDDQAYALQKATALTASLFRLEAESDGQLEVVRSADELDMCLQQNTLAAVLHFEGAEAIDSELDALYVFYEAGLRSLGIVWSRSNAFGHGVPFKFPHSPDSGPGLTEAGRELVRACNRLGVAVDVSHLNEQGFWDVARLSDAPLVATHSSVHALCPSARNLGDKQLDAIGESEGIVGVNFHVAFLRGDGKHDADTPLIEIVHHIDYIAQRIGIDHVAFGSDFDGATMPQELGDAAGLPKLIAALRERGYDDAALAKVAHENWLRVLRNTWKE